MQWAVVSGGNCTADPNRREQKDGAGFGVFSPAFFFVSENAGACHLLLKAAALILLKYSGQ